LREKEQPLIAAGRVLLFVQSSSGERAPGLPASIGACNRGHYEDMSPWAVHFTTPNQTQPIEEPLRKGWIEGLLDFLERRRLEDTTGYWNSLSILGSGFIRPFAEPHGAGKDVPEVADLHRSSALSEIPLHLLDRLIQNRSPYGVGFHQDALIRAGGARVWYVEDPGPIAATIQSQVQTRVNAGVDPEDAFWRMTPFIDFAKPDSVWEDWRWEREWRLPGGLRFKPEDVAFLFLPEDSHNAARQFFVDHHTANTGPAYLCPYIDPRWPAAESSWLSSRCRELRSRRPKRATTHLTTGTIRTRSAPEGDGLGAVRRFGRFLAQWACTWALKQDRRRHKHVAPTRRQTQTHTLKHDLRVGQNRPHGETPTS